MQVPSGALLVATSALLRVSDILKGDGAWDLAQMSVELPFEIRDMMVSTPTGVLSGNGDFRAWKFSSSGYFSTKLAYELVCGRDTLQKGNKWGWL